MKIAILTLPLNVNYGGILQNYAVQTVLQRMGHEVETINLKKILLAKKYDISFLTRICSIGKPAYQHKVRHFIEHNLKMTSPIYNKEELMRYDFSRFDAVVVGSDQVWRLRYAYPDIDTYFLDFIKNESSASKRIRKIAFAASFGIDEAEYNNEQRKRCGAYIQDFDLVTVREASGVSLIQDHYQWSCKNSPVHVFDPTTLLCKDDYLSVSKAYHSTKNQGGLFYYVLDMTEEKWKLIQKIANDLGVKPFTVKWKKHKWYQFVSKEEKVVPAPEEWLQAFHQASYVFTDSFHGTVFSLLFHKPFVSFGNQKRGMSRFLSLLEHFHLTDRLIHNATDYRKEHYTENIDWHRIDAMMNIERTKVEKCLSAVLQS